MGLNILFLFFVFSGKVSRMGSLSIVPKSFAVLLWCIAFFFPCCPICKRQWNYRTVSLQKMHSVLQFFFENEKMDFRCFVLLPFRSVSVLFASSAKVIVTKRSAISVSFFHTARTSGNCMFSNSNFRRIKNQFIHHVIIIVILKNCTLQ